MGMIMLLLVSYSLCFGLMNEKLKPLNSFLYGIPWAGSFFARMFDCAYCTGFHTGWISWTVWRVSGGPDLGTGTNYVEAILFALVSSVFCYSFDMALRRLEQ